MDLFDEKIDELLAKHLAGECSPEEEQALRSWLEESPEHEQHLSELQWLWERSAAGLEAPPRPVDTEAALQRVKNRLQSGSGGAGQGFTLRWQRGFLMRAAAILVLAIAAVYWWQVSMQPQPVQILADATALTETLTDGSVVQLEQASGLTLATDFNRRERRMRLEGKANFAVAHDTTRPFVVEVLDLQVQVVGTVFTVDNKSNPEKVFVSVSEGKVRVSLGGTTLLLTAGERAVYTINTATLTRMAPEQGQPAEKNRIFRFDATPLHMVVEQISRVYGVDITIQNEALNNCPLTAQYNNLPLERLLDLVAETFSIELEKAGDVYVLRGEGCDE
ncbi:MAG: DUF4974 domain-containing protein [Bacteroidetes bacterium]|nr:MAG: DUF4974 domain-containing protein [Bacteroidota bacterium]